MSKSRSKSSLVPGPSFWSMLNGLVEESERAKAEKDRCPVCDKPAALITLTFRGRLLGKVCRFCYHPRTVVMMLSEKEKALSAEVRKKSCK
jgi:hypothetical protein